MNRLLTLTVVLMVSATAAFGQDTVRMTLDSCLRYVQQHNLQVALSAANQHYSHQ